VALIVFNLHYYGQFPTFPSKKKGEIKIVSEKKNPNKNKNQNQNKNKNQRAVFTFQQIWLMRDQGKRG
jgi:hypothetical protein